MSSQLVNRFLHRGRRQTNPRSGQATPTIALVGCGAIAERYHLPALAAHPNVIRQLVLVDREEERARALAKRFDVSRWSGDCRDWIPELDGAIVAVPPALHHPICMELLGHGIHVLCEKPLAETPHEARQMVEEARANGVTLSVNHTRRLFPAYATIRELLAQQAIGELISLRYHDGTEFDWPAASAFHFRSGSRGVLLDTGIHVLDLTCWWLGGKPAVVSSETDSFGGPESVAHLRLRQGTCDIEVKLSWLSRLDNRYEIVGRHGRIYGGNDDWRHVTIEHANGRRKRIRTPGAAQTYNDFGRLMIANFFDVLAGRAEPLVPGHEVIAPLELMDECYQAARPFRLPWFETAEAICDV